MDQSGFVSPTLRRRASLVADQTASSRPASSRCQLYVPVADLLAALRPF
jgi:hypothetical protein